MAQWLRLWFLPKGAPMAQWRAAGGKKSDPLVCMNCPEGTSGHWRLAPALGLSPRRWHRRPPMSGRRHRQGAAGRGHPAVKISRAYQPGHWLNEHDALIVKADYQEPLVILRLSLAADIAKKVAA